VSAVRHACWHPKDRTEFMSCGEDGTLRLWDINKVKKCKTVIKTKNKQARKTPATYCAYTRDNQLIFAGCGNGSIQAWDPRKFFVNTTLNLQNAHGDGTDITSIGFSHDTNAICSRGMDDTLKLWDLRNFKMPVNVKTGLTTYYATTRCMFSPNDKMVITGTAAKKNQGNSELLFYDRDTFKEVKRVTFTDCSVVSCLWHPKLNQVCVGLSTGSVKVLFDPEKSNKGAKLCVGKVKRAVYDPGEDLLQPQIINPHALRMYKEKRNDTVKKIKAKQRADPIASKAPEAPIEGRGYGGRLKEGTSLAGFVIKNIATKNFDTRNPREALLAQDGAAKADPFWVAPAYKATQPEAIWHESSDEDEEEDDGIVRIPAKKPKL